MVSSFNCLVALLEMVNGNHFYWNFHFDATRQFFKASTDELRRVEILAEKFFLLKSNVTWLICKIYKTCYSYCVIKVVPIPILLYFSYQYLFPTLIFVNLIPIPVLLVCFITSYLSPVFSLFSIPIHICHKFVLFFSAFR